jgi:hypothetical protein
VKQLVLESCLVPNTVFVEDEDLSSLVVTPDEILIKEVCLPHKIRNVILSDFLKVLDVDDLKVDISEERWSVESHLLGVWPQLSMPAKVLGLNPSLWDVHQTNHSW